MPQLFSRMDEINWLTPSVSDILDQGTSQPGGDGSIREQMLLLQNKLGELETPARVINVRPTPSYTMFIAKPDIVNWQGNRRAVTINEIKRSIGQIAEEKKEWKLGFLPELQEVADTVGILLRTDHHRPLSIRRLLVHTTYRNHPSTLALAIGSTLEQRLIVHDLAEIGNIGIIGKPENRQNFIHNILLSLTMLNTPGELRLVVAGQSSVETRAFVNLPHALGRLLTEPEDFSRLLGGLVKELQRRQQWITESDVDDIEAYNKLLQERDKTRIPRIVVLIDALSDDTWVAAQSTWLENLNTILEDGGKSGLHIIATTAQPQAPHFPEAIARNIALKLVMRSAANEYASHLENFHGSLVRFIDALIIKDDSIIPIESCVVSDDEIERAVGYWSQAIQQRKDETHTTRVSGTTGVTGMLKATAVETNENDKQQHPATDIQQQPRFDETQQASVVPFHDEEAILQHARALAAYLGWISIGPLQDVLGLSTEQAEETLAALKQMHIVENGNTRTPRFIRLQDAENDTTEVE